MGFKYLILLFSPTNTLKIWVISPRFRGDDYKIRLTTPHILFRRFHRVFSCCLRGLREFFAHFSSLAVQYRTTRGAGVASRRSLTTQNCRYDYAFPLTPYPLLLADNLACSSYLGDGHYVAFIDEIAFIGPIFRHLFTHQLRLLRFFVAFPPKRSSRVFPRSSILGIASKNVPFFSAIPLI